MPISKTQLNQTQADVNSALASDPATGAGKGSWYPKLISGVVEFVYKDDQGRIIQLTQNGAAAGGGGGGGSVSDVAYDATSWDGVTSTAPSKNAVRDKFASVDAAIANKQDALSIVSQAEAEAGVATTPRLWTAERVAQAIAALAEGGGGGAISDAAYDSSWNGVTNVAPSKNAVYDALESLSAATTSALSGKQDALSTVSQAEAEAGVATTGRIWTAQRVAQAIAAQAGGGGSVSDVAYDQSSWDGVTSTAPSKNAVRDKFVSVDSAIANKQDALSIVSQAEAEAGVATTARLWTSERVAQAIAAQAEGGGESNEFRFSLPANTTIAARIPNVVGLPSGWALATADTAAEGQFSNNADTLVITWDSGLGTKLAEITVFQATTAGPAATQGIQQLDTWVAGVVKTKTDMTKAAVYLNGLGVSTTKDLYVMIRLI